MERPSFPSRSTTTGERLRPPRSTPIRRSGARRGYDSRPDARASKPYRVYRGGRAKGRVTLAASPAAGTRRSIRPRPREAAPAPLGTLDRARGSPCLLVLSSSGSWPSYLSFSSGISEANGRLPGARDLADWSPRTAPPSTPTTILVLGTDGGTAPGATTRTARTRSCSIRTDPRKHRLAYLSIPRDLRVEIPGHGAAKINAAIQLGGRRSRSRTVRTSRGSRSTTSRRRLRPVPGSDRRARGIEIDVPRPILSNRFDCPLRDRSGVGRGTAGASTRGKQHMDGRRALVYSPDPREPPRPVRDGPRPRTAPAAGAPGDGGQGDARRHRGQAPVPGGSHRHAARDRSHARDGAPARLGVLPRRTRRARLHCRLGGEPGTPTGESVILGWRTTSRRSRCSRAARRRCASAEGCRTRRAAWWATASAVSRQSVAGASVSLEPESFSSVLLLRHRLLGPTPGCPRPSPASSSSPCRSRSSRSRSP